MHEVKNSVQRDGPGDQEAALEGHAGAGVLAQRDVHSAAPPCREGSAALAGVERLRDPEGGGGGGAEVFRRAG